MENPKILCFGWDKYLATHRPLRCHQSAVCALVWAASSSFSQRNEVSDAVLRLHYVMCKCLLPYKSNALSVLCLIAAICNFDGAVTCGPRVASYRNRAVSLQNASSLRQNGGRSWKNVISLITCVWWANPFRRLSLLHWSPSVFTSKHRWETKSWISELWFYLKLLQIPNNSPSSFSLKHSCVYVCVLSLWFTLCICVSDLCVHMWTSLSAWHLLFSSVIRTRARLQNRRHVSMLIHSETNRGIALLNKSGMSDAQCGWEAC